MPDACLSFLIVLQVLHADRPKQQPDTKLVYVDKDRARQREEKALQVEAAAVLAVVVVVQQSGCWQLSTYLAVAQCRRAFQ